MPKNNNRYLNYGNRLSQTSNNNNNRDSTNDDNDSLYNYQLNIVDDEADDENTAFDENEENMKDIGEFDDEESNFNKIFKSIEIKNDNSPIYKLNNINYGHYSNSSTLQEFPSSSSYIPSISQKTSCLKKTKPLAANCFEDLPVESPGQKIEINYAQSLNETISSSIQPVLPEATSECICNNLTTNLDDSQTSISSNLNLKSISLPKQNSDLNKKSQNSFNISSSQSGNSGLNHSIFKDCNNSNRILEGLNNLRQSNCLCDVVLNVAGSEFNLHKCVLASLSSYFRAMFSGDLVESKQSLVSINNIDSLTMKLIIDYAYTNELDIHENNVQALLTAANLFDIKSIKDACSRYMSINMDPLNCVGIHCFSETHDCLELKQNSFNYILQNFTKVILYDEYLNLPKTKLIEIISDDNLNVQIEDIVFNACIKWLDYSSETRANEFYQILEHVRLPLLSAYFLYDKVQSEERIKQCDKSRELIQEALMYNLLKDRRNQVQNERTRSRKSFSHVEALIVVGGEDDRVVLRTLDAYFPTLDRWQSLQCSPYALSKHCVVSACGENILYLAGGEIPDGTQNETFWSFNTILDEWKQLSNLTVPRAEFGMAIVDGCIYACGGVTICDKRLQTIERYDPLLNMWKSCSPMKVAVSSPAVCSLNGLLYCIGGTIDGKDIVDINHCYNPASDSWKELNKMMLPRTGCTACALNGLIYVIGGWLPREENSNRVECYDPKLDKFFLIKNMIEKRYRPAVAVLNNRIYVCGGECYDVFHDSIECFDCSINEWQIITLMNSGRSWLACATLRLQNPLFDNNGISSGLIEFDDNNNDEDDI